MAILKEKRIIGSIETVDLPEIGLYQILAKIDTGAETSVLHCERYVVFEENGHRFIRCFIDGHPENHSGQLIEVTFPIYRERTVKSSFGQAETRHIFITKIKLHNELFDIKLSVRDRSSMTYPMLLGRNFISGKFLVDVSKKNLSKKSL
ncbi:RimK/LysX family protein [Sphingobacterium sp. UT-1RO-CII-1]|uniref:ATP-dependent zinc protease family protein n=1 Tax=Sphingobacterium sp. UT-1RO-CII-1 TaxID=2995225 RepID=UPI00227D6EB4|nr:RimK/LysX family protein [Sphingobacterium sp. UT-1RO-CII-1]MCY4780504.1 RimK/LysX family protein [Sphingobacterium sp. UT-1RO-CII-1]